MPDDENDGQWYYCLHHRRVESTDRCASRLIMGPYDSPEEAERYAETAQQRNDVWEAEDERWEGG